MNKEEKMLVSITFSFCHKDFKRLCPQGCKNAALFEPTTRRQNFRLVQIETFADDILKCIQNGKQVSYIVGMGTSNRLIEYSIERPIIE